MEPNKTTVIKCGPLLIHIFSLRLLLSLTPSWEAYEYIFNDDTIPMAMVDLSI